MIPLTDEQLNNLLRAYDQADPTQQRRIVGLLMMNLGRATKILEEWAYEFPDLDQILQGESSRKAYKLLRLTRHFMTEILNEFQKKEMAKDGPPATPG